MSQFNASNLPSELILIIHEKLLETTDPQSAWRSLQINRNWRFGSTLTVDFVDCRAFVLDTDTSLDVLNHFLNTILQRNSTTEKLTIIVKNVDLLGGIAIDDCDIQFITFIFHAQDCSIRMPPMRLRDYCSVHFETHQPTSLYVRTRIAVDIRGIVTSPIHSYNQPLFCYGFADVVPKARSDQFENCLSVRISGDPTAIGDFLYKTLLTIDPMSEQLMIDNYGMTPLNELLPLALPSLSGLRQVGISNVVLDARTAHLPHLRMVDATNASIILRTDSSLFNSLEKLRIWMFHDDSPSTTQEQGDIYLTEPRGLLQLTNIRTLLVDMPKDHHLADFLLRGMFTDFLRTVRRFCIRTSTTVTSDKEINYDAPTDLYSTDEENINGGHIDGGDFRERHSDADDESDNDDEDDDDENDGVFIDD